MRPEHLEVLATDSGHGRGLSQEGASRWARGNRCSYSGAGDQPYSAKWERPEQILYHYYTNVDLKDQNTYLIGATYRWVPLEFSWFTLDNLPRFNTGDAHLIEITIQNAGSIDWTCDYPTTNFELHYRWRNSIYGTHEGANTVNICGLTKGDPARTVSLFINDVPSTPFNGTPWYLEFDIYRNWTGGVEKFSDLGWAPYSVNACYNGFCNLAVLPVIYDGQFTGITTDPQPTPSVRTYIPNTTREQLTLW